MLLQDRQRDLCIVGIAIVKGDAGGAPGQETMLEQLDCLEQRHDPEVTFEQSQLSIKCGSIDLAGEQWIGLRQYAVVDQDG